MGYLKYVVVKIKGNPTPILFPASLNHDAVVEALADNDLCSEKVISAGQVSIIGKDDFHVACYGESLTLKVSANHEADGKLIKKNLDAYN